MWDTQQLSKYTSKRICNHLIIIFMRIEFKLLSHVLLVLMTDNVWQRSAYSVGLLFVSSLIHNLHNDYIS